MRFSIVLFLLINGFVFYSQNSGNSLDIDEKDFELYKNFLPDIEINASNAEYVRKWNRTKFYVKSVYDYSVISSAMLSAFEDTLSTISKQRNKNKYLKKANKMLKKEFGEEIKDMSITRGTYLMKLIYRNTGLTAYDIIKKYRGSGTAFWFQALCTISGQDLKKEYDPDNEDFLINKAVRLIESGDMTYFKRVPLTKEARKALEKKRKKARRQKKKKK
tara:strand:+ start:4326 stop:4979 length:654 start_codon:yes stop_codon:yes gene_type:complete